QFGADMCQWLSERGYAVEQSSSAGEAVTLAEKHPLDVAILGLELKGMDGIQLMEELRHVTPDTAAIIVTSKGSIPSAVQAMRHGAFTYLTQPCKWADLELEIKEACNQTRLARHDPPDKAYDDSPVQILGTSPAIQEVLHQLRKMAPTEERVLILGESGTGKELVARELHRVSSRGNGPFVAVNCAALQESLLESELFGHEKGAFTSAVTSKPGLFEVASDGTLFIDEIGEMRLELQAKLLRVLEDGCIRRVGSTHWIQTNARVVAATNKELGAEVSRGHFRKDLYYRLSVLTLRLPPFRERREDIPLLVEHFLNAGPNGPHEIEPEALEALTRYNWPGNIREMENALTQARILSESRKITLRDLPEEILAAVRGASPAPSAHNGTARGAASLDELEARHVREALEAEGWNKSRAAARLGISRHRLYRLITRFGLEPG
ncbi:MAG: sigma-54-dependent transcriptional regulator, partial [Gemmataceae bacterium]